VIVDGQSYLLLIRDEGGPPELQVHTLSTASVPDPGSGMGEKSRSGSGMHIPDHIPKSLEKIFWVKNT